MITTIDTETYFCASGTVSVPFNVNRVQICAFLCIDNPCCVHFNAERRGPSEYLCRMSNMCHADLSEPPAFTAEGTWYALN